MAAVAADAAATSLEHPELEVKANDEHEFRPWLHGLVRNAIAKSERDQRRQAQHETSLTSGEAEDDDSAESLTRMVDTAMGPTATRDPNLEWDAAIAAANPGIKGRELRRLQELTVTREEYDAMPDIKVAWHRRAYAPVPGLRSDSAEDAYYDAADQRESEAIAEGTLARMTPRQEAILQLVDNGRTNAEIAEELGISESTVRVQRLKVRSRVA
jgi:RNA polymerase sigma factor (sigma-70 family)